MIRKCKLCEFWQKENGRCHRNSPSISPGSHQLPWPTTQGEEWCGQFQYDEKLERRIPRNCKFCEFWKTEGFNQESGECHCNPPVASTDQDQAFWPTTQDKEWCGEFEQRRGKLAVGVDKCPVSQSQSNCL
ncbi:MAG: hypothetical protein ACYS30_21830 [Planctomycetota bacterium]